MDTWTLMGDTLSSASLIVLNLVRLWTDYFRSLMRMRLPALQFWLQHFNNCYDHRQVTVSLLCIKCNSTYLVTCICVKVL